MKKINNNNTNLVLVDLCVYAYHIYVVRRFVLKLCLVYVIIEKSVIIFD